MDEAEQDRTVEGAFALGARSARRAPHAPQLGECECMLYFLLLTKGSLVWEHSITDSPETSLIVFISVWREINPGSAHGPGAALRGFVFWFIQALGGTSPSQWAGWTTAVPSASQQASYGYWK